MQYTVIVVVVVVQLLSNVLAYTIHLSWPPVFSSLILSPRPRRVTVQRDRHREPIFPKDSTTQKISRFRFNSLTLCTRPSSGVVSSSRTLQLYPSRQQLTKRHVLYAQTIQHCIASASAFEPRTRNSSKTCAYFSPRLKFVHSIFLNIIKQPLLGRYLNL
jgi:hypothetical protein